MAKKKTNVSKSCDTGCGCGCNCAKINKCCGPGMIYGLGFVGAAIYYISTATGFWMGVLGILKALVWPAFVVFQMLTAFAV